MEVSDKTVIDFIKVLEDSKISAKDSHKNKAFVENVKLIVSMPKEVFSAFMEKTTNEKVILIYNEYCDWIQSYNEK